MTPMMEIRMEEERRRDQRVAVRMRGRFSSMREWRSLCRIDNVSRRGVHLKTEIDLDEGAAIWLRLPGMEPRPGRVMWSDNLNAGCQFDDPLELAELERLVAQRDVRGVLD
jgi:hypothetical protein